MKSKKSLLVILLILVVGVVGLTLAYFSNTASVENTFNTKQYGTTVNEVFESPDNWTPGTTTPKTLTITNSGNVDEAVRISYRETWTSANSNTEGDLELSQGNNRAAIINFANSSDWTKVTENNKDYYYYNYKLAPGEVTSTLLDSVTFNSAITNSSNCTTSETATGKQVVCSSTGAGYDGATYKLVFTVETIQYDKYMSAWGTNVAVAETKELKVKGLKVNASGAEYNASTKSDLFVMTHPQTDQTPAQTEYRYIGDNPNNYVYFNCDDLNNQNSDTCEVWRIIGVFDVEDGTGNYEQRIKLVRGSALPDTKQWDTRTSEMYPNDNYGKNEWEGSLMQMYLNDEGEYYTRSGSAANYGLKTSAKTLIGDAKYYLGGAAYNSNGYGTADAIYLWERGTEVYNQNNATRNTSWVGEVALMYPSDQYLVYSNGVDAACYGNPEKCKMGSSNSYGTPSAGWIYNSNNLEGQNSPTWNWFVSPLSSRSDNVFRDFSDGNLYGYFYASNAGGVRPVVYLKSNIKIATGTGESSNPYKLGL